MLFKSKLPQTTGNIPTRGNKISKLVSAINDTPTFSVEVEISRGAEMTTLVLNFKKQVEKKES